MSEGKINNNNLCLTWLYYRVVDKLEAAGLKEKRHIGGASGTNASGTINSNRRRKEKALPEGMSAPSARDRHLLQPTDDGAIPVEVGYLCVLVPLYHATAVLYTPCYLYKVHRTITFSTHHEYVLYVRTRYQVCAFLLIVDKHNVW